MKILFAIQGTGNGHLSRAKDVYPELARHGEVDVLISGIQADVAFPYPVKYQRKGLSFMFGKKGGVDIWATTRKLELAQLIKDIRSIDVTQYDLVINDFEPVSAWACKRKKMPCISLSHQCAVLHPDAPKATYTDPIGKLVLEKYAPVTDAYGFHFRAIGDQIFTPVIRKEIRQLNPVNKGHYTVYLPAFSDETIIKHLSTFPDVQWQVFSKHNKQPISQGNIQIVPVNNEGFTRSLESCEGILCGAGFEGPAEAMYLGKKVMVVPMKGQYEQHLNAAGAKEMGASVIETLSEEYLPEIGNWLKNGKAISVNYPDMTGQIVDMIVARHARR